MRAWQIARPWWIRRWAQSVHSPRGTTVLADIPDQFGPGRTATMAYYETRAGARVFAAGAMGFESPQTPVHKQLLDNVWRRLTRP